MGPDIASRLRARFSRRRHSTAPSLTSTQSNTDSSSLPSRAHSSRRATPADLSEESRYQREAAVSPVTAQSCDCVPPGDFKPATVSASGDTLEEPVTSSTSHCIAHPSQTQQQQDGTQFGGATEAVTVADPLGAPPSPLRQTGGDDQHSATAATTAEQQSQILPLQPQQSQPQPQPRPLPETETSPTPSQATPLSPPSSQPLAPRADLNQQLPASPTEYPPPSQARDSQTTTAPTSNLKSRAHHRDTEAPDRNSEASPCNDDDSLSLGTVYLSSSIVSESPARPAAPLRRQSLLPTRQAGLIKTLLHSPSIIAYDPATEYPSLPPIDAAMVTRKIWVKRSHASPTLITVNEDDLVDDVRDLILRKYANSLGRTFDSPDLNIRIYPRDQHKDRILGPEEHVGRTLDTYYPGGQTVDEALIIDIPRRGPKASPRPTGPPVNYGGNAYYAAEDCRPSETGEGYFPPVGAVASPHLPVAVPVQASSQAPHSIAVLGTGHIPPIPSPGAGRSRTYRDRPERPRLGRTHTSSPTILANGQAASVTTPAPHSTQPFNPRLPRSRTQSNSSDNPGGAPPAPPPLPTPPAPEPTQAIVATPPPRHSSPRPSSNRPKKSKKAADHPNPPPGMLNGGVPPINVLIVEDNPINLKLLEAFVKRLKVRWQTAMNGRDAVSKWRSGGFHLVLMDIQLPVMNGLDATREIRRLERVNSIGVFSSSPDSSVPEETVDELKEQDRLENLGLFKSPVIIVALTASSLQSDRHEALAAGCNDFLTKPVNFVWLERKVMEWGCMQALIDFDGWRKWKDFSQEAEENEASKKAAAAAAAAATKTKSKKNRNSISSTAA